MGVRLVSRTCTCFPQHIVMETESGALSEQSKGNCVKEIFQTIMLIQLQY